VGLMHFVAVRAQAKEAPLAVQRSSKQSSNLFQNEITTTQHGCLVLSNTACHYQQAKQRMSLFLKHHSQRLTLALIHSNQTLLPHSCT
jgi:hypothetical protein